VVTLIAQSEKAELKAFRKSDIKINMDLSDQRYHRMMLFWDENRKADTLKIIDRTML
jgi:hypothetical protein